MPQTGLNIFRPALNSPANEQNIDVAISQAALTSQRPQRHSSGVTFGGVGENSRYDLAGVNSVTSSITRPMSLQSSYSTNDVPTMKTSSGAATNITPSKPYAGQQFQNHTANMGRIPPGASSNRQSRDFPHAPGTAESRGMTKVRACSRSSKQARHHLGYT